MSTSAIGPVFTYLIANLPGVVQAVYPAVVVADGWVTDVGDDMLIIGSSGPDTPESDQATHLYQELGAQRVEEQFEIPCYIDCWVGGSDQSEARNRALAIFNAVVTFVRSDLTFGGALLSGRWGQITNIRMEHTRDITEAQSGRRWTISFSISCKNLY